MMSVLLSTILFMLLLTACGSKELTIKDSWARSGFIGGNSAAYMTINNPTDRDDLLLNATADIAEVVELHISKMDDQGVMMMERQENIPIDADSEVELKPGGLHVMLINLKEDMVVGTTIQLTLTFQEAGEVELEIPVKSP